MYSISSSIDLDDFGVRQRSVLSPLLFALFIDDVSNFCTTANGSRYILYADDLLLIAPSVSLLSWNIYCIYAKIN